jgi:hypothetical protein
MSLYLAKSEWISQGSTYPNPIDLMNVDLFKDYKKIDCKLSVYELNKYFEDEPFLKAISYCGFIGKRTNSNDMQMIRDKGFTILYHSCGLYWLLFDIDNPALTDFRRDFKLRQILDNRESKLNQIITI